MNRGRSKMTEEQADVLVSRRGAEVKVMDENAIGTKLIEDKVIAGLKSVEKVSPANKKQTQTYLRLTGNKLGYLLNFGGEVMKSGITRCVNGLPE